MPGSPSLEPPRLDAILFELEAMPEWLEALARGVDPRRLTRPAPGGGYSLVEHVWHLADLEREGFGARIERLQEEQEPFLPDFEGDRIARERDYRSRDLDEGLAGFRAARARNLERLRGVGRGAWEASGLQEHVGPVRLRDIPVKMAEHDASHREEIRQLLSALDAAGPEQ